MRRAIVTGQHRYTSDMKRPGMLYGKVLRPAGFDAALERWISRREAVPASRVVHDGDFVGVAAANELAAAKALAGRQGGVEDDAAAVRAGVVRLSASATRSEAAAEACRWICQTGAPAHTS